MKVLGIDFGEKKIGLAIADGHLALPFKVIRGNQPSLIKEIIDICYEEDVKQIVIGLPLGGEGTENPMTAKVRKFGQKLAERFKQEVDLWDERLTSQEAQERLGKAGFLRKRRIAREDSVAAAITLQSYLDSRK
jgi:putative Holliday junction resolvase